jgi:protease-4
MNEEACASQHIGIWAAKESWLEWAVSSYNAGTLPKVKTDEYDQRLYSVGSDGIATVAITGQMTKGRSSFGGTSNIQTRKALRVAENDSDVRGIMLLIDSPGGTVAGQQPMADEIARIAKSGRKPLWAHADDGMHSAALWAGVQAARLTASPMTEIGSIGTVARVEDTSGAYEQRGIKVHMRSTGPMKGAFAPGTAITEEQLDKLDVRLEEMNGFFLKAVASGRKMPIADVRELATGDDWMAAEAKDKGLIDEVMSRDDAYRAMRRMLDDRDRGRQAASRRSGRMAKIADLGG